MINAPKNFAELVSQFIGLLGLLIPFIFSVTILVLVWKIVDTWIINAGDANKVEEGKQFVIISVIVLVVMASIWGILALLRSSLFGI